MWWFGVRCSELVQPAANLEVPRMPTLSAPSALSQLFSWCLPQSHATWFPLVSMLSSITLTGFTLPGPQCGEMLRVSEGTADCSGTGPAPKREEHG